MTTFPGQMIGQNLAYLMAVFARRRDGKRHIWGVQLNTEYFFPSNSAQQSPSSQHNKTSQQQKYYFPENSFSWTIEFPIMLFMIFFYTHSFFTTPMVNLSYWFFYNFFYWACIAPDHDQFESAVTNHEMRAGSRDWGEMQVR